MSAYCQVRTKFKDAKMLADSLLALGYENVEIHDKAQALVGYSHEATMYANVIVRRKDGKGVSKDFGYLKQADGTYTAMINDMDSHRFTKDWNNKFANTYAERAVRDKMKRLGVRPVGTKQIGNKLVMEFVQH